MFPIAPTGPRRYNERGGTNEAAQVGGGGDGNDAADFLRQPAASGRGTSASRDLDEARADAPTAGTRWHTSSASRKSMPGYRSPCVGGPTSFAGLPAGSYTIDRVYTTAGPGIAGGLYTDGSAPDPIGPWKFTLRQGEITILPVAIALTVEPWGPDSHFQSLTPERVDRGQVVDRLARYPNFDRWRIAAESRSRRLSRSRHRVRAASTTASSGTDPATGFRGIAAARTSGTRRPRAFLTGPTGRRCLEPAIPGFRPCPNRRAGRRTGSMEARRRSGS